MRDIDVDIVGVGIGPFNLSLAALSASIPELRTRFFDRQPRFDWHPGMMIEGTVLQVPFLADLVTAADPTSPYSFLSYMKRSGRLYQFAIREAYFLTRHQYNDYCRWASAQLPSLEFGTEVTGVYFEPERDAYRVEFRRVGSGLTGAVRARCVVVGVGTVPSTPACVPDPLPARTIHSSEYMGARVTLRAAGSILVIGSGQSAAEIFADLLETKADDAELYWLTRSERFFPMDYSKLSLEMASVDYIDHFHGLSSAQRRAVLAGQDELYKGVSAELLGRIYDRLHDRSISQPRDDVHLTPGVELEALRADGDEVRARFRHLRLEQRFDVTAEQVVLATGYEYRLPRCLAPVLEPGVTSDTLRVRRNYSIAGHEDRLFVQNAESHTHGFASSDLSLGAYRSSIILNTILGREHFLVERRTAFQEFGIPRGAELVPAESGARGGLGTPAHHAATLAEPQ